MKEYYIISTKYNIAERKTKLNGKVYDIRFRVINAQTGEVMQKRLSGFATKALAKAAYAEFTRDNCELVRENPFKVKQTDKTAPTVGVLAQEYLGSRSNQMKEQSLYDLKSIFKNHIIPDLGDMKITALTTETLYKWQDALYQKKKPGKEEYYSHARLKNIRADLYTFLEWVRKRYGYENNLENVDAVKDKSVKRKVKADNIWTEEQFKRFISVADNEIFKALFSLLFYTGKRKHEILALSPSDVRGNTILITKTLTRKSLNRAEGETYAITPTKAYKEDALPICPAAERALNEYMRTDSYDPKAKFLFGGDKPLAENTITRTFKRYTAEAGLPEIRMHDLRHSFASMLIHHGANLSVVADLLNDTLEQVTKTYAHMYDSDRISVLSSIK